MKTAIKNVVKSLGYDLVRIANSDDRSAADITKDEKNVYETVKPLTMTGLNSIISLIHAVEYIVENEIKGDFVECGVWRGGSMMAIALTLKQLSETDRQLFLYDTFSGMVEPTEKDTQFDGKPAAQVWQENNSQAWCDASLAEVKRNLEKTGYPSSNIRYVEGRVEDTIPQIIPEKISLLRLDTDWYDSTKHELENLYPRLVPHGILIIDDYGHWSGAKIATDEFFAKQKFKPLLQRIDYTGRLAIKPPEF